MPENTESPPRRTASRIIGRLAGYLTLFALSSLIALLIAEFAVRIAAPQQLIQVQPDLWEPADSLGYARRAHADVVMNTGERSVTVRTDADGFRIGEAGRQDAPTQLLLMGDSFVEALQVEHEQTTTALLESGLEHELGEPVVVRNAGVSGWGPNQYLIDTRRRVARDSFDLVIVALFVGNDAVPKRTDYLPPRQALARHPFRFPRSLSGSELVSALAMPLNEALETRSHLFVLFKNQLATLRMRLGLTADYMPLEYRKDQADAERWGIAAGLSRDLADAVAAAGAPTLFVLVPERFQVYSDEFRRYLVGFGIDSSTVDLDQPSRKLLEFLTAEGLRVVDALPVFRAAAQDSPRLFGTVDQHLSPAGHVVLADLLTREAAKVLGR